MYPLPGDGDDWSFYFSGPFPLLRLLGDNAHPHVSFNWSMGCTCPQNLCCGKILPLYHVWQFINAGCDSGIILLPSQRNRHLHL